jgi:hypothetical protein
MLKLDVNPTSKEIYLVIQPKGEPEPISIKISKYELITEGKKGIKISQISTSKEWLNIIIDEFFKETFIDFEHANILKIVF